MSQPPHPIALEAARLQQLGRRREAIDRYRLLLEQRPHDADAWYNLGWLLRHESRFEAALDAYGQALRHAVREPEEVHLNRAAILSDHLRRDDEAEAELERALAIAPAYVPAHLNLGNLHEERGRRDAAIASYERVLRLAGATTSAAQAEAQARLLHLCPPHAGDARLDEVESMAGRAALESSSRATLWFALGRACERLGEQARAFEAFRAGNRLVRAEGRAYQPDKMGQLVDAIIAGSPSRTAWDAPRAVSTPRPLFICGMFRSGSTLVERVLGAHLEVIAGGELDWFPRLAAGPLAPFPTAPARLDDAQSEALAAAYLAHLGTLFPAAAGARYVSDKRPDNFLLIGIIKRLFPDALIVHTTRDPLDTGWSIYTQHLHAASLPYANDLGDIGHYYGQYRRLMRHWSSLYANDLLDFDYDAFVHAPRPSLARLLEFLGLDWHEDCLDFHRQAATVKTASYWQVREPLHASASGRSRAFAAQLEPLRRSLTQAGVAWNE